ERRGEDGFDELWRCALNEGRIAETATGARPVAPLSLDAAVYEAAPAASAPGAIELVFRPDPAVWDGRFANNGWLQEMPRPLTKITWDNVVLIAPATAARLGVASGDVVRLARGARGVEAPVWLMPGQAEDSIAV